MKDKNKKIKIFFVLPNLRAGGAERVTSFVAQKLNPEIFDATLIIMGYEDEAAYKIEHIKLIFYNKSRVKSGIIKLCKQFLTDKPDIVLSAAGHLNTLMSYMTFIFPKIKFVAREVNVLSVLSQFVKPSKVSVLNYIGENRFNRFDKIICQSEDMLNDLRKTYDIEPDKIIIINNPVTSSFILKDHCGVSHPIQFITVARLVKQKGHLRVLEILGKISFPFHYTIIGDGPEKESLLKRATELGIEKSITSVPFTNDVATFLKKSDLYLQGSHVEGFPNAVIESCMVGTPVLALNAPGGINEIIISGKNGYVLENEAEFIKQLEEISSHYTFKASEVSETISDRYSEEIIIKKYENFFTDLMKK